VEYRKHLFHFLNDTKGEITLQGDTLIFDMKNQVMGKEELFKAKCVRDSVQ
jgi:hypothetical protein